MQTVCDLTNKHCVPCEGGVLPLTPAEFAPMLAEVQGWQVIDDHKKLQKNFKLKDFKTTIALVNKIAEIAESEGHHPDLNITGWNHLQVTLSTHAIKGLSENDFILAAKIDELPVPTS